MTKSKKELVTKLSELTGSMDPEWEKWPVHRILLEIDRLKQDEVADFTSRIVGAYKN